MVAAATVLLLATAQLATAHFALDYPDWRANTLTSGTNYSQWIYPCGGVPGNSGNRTDWPLSGGSLILELHHPWTYVFVNLGLGANVSNFNYTLTPNFWNATGNGTLCVPEIKLPAELKVDDGTQASVQVVTVGESGSALYNCADITFRSSAKALAGDQCKTNNVTLTEITQQSSSSSSPTSTSSSQPPKSTSAASLAGVNVAVLGLAVVFAYGMSL
ncbi:hypothetical protein QBC47DRAFT_389023 [Echria macrotheca]|uniref:Copper acquisition factor BIM1-like domain-containing protein n=1 Tax=Echria macrotheca TaxID=438768 RepID=A0AAJ0B6K8_9PEZI|nr:hypothetical protein QBC47DRAFT_389023 [Echria macrotheca]